jgi:hypothetical protein
LSTRSNWRWATNIERIPFGYAANVPLTAATQRSDGTTDEPGRNSTWDQWVAASRTSNFCCDDPLIDWLDLFGRVNGFLPDDERPGYDGRTDFRRYLFAQARQFEDVVTSYLKAGQQLVRIRLEASDVTRHEAVESTWNAMVEGVEIISQGVLWNPETRTYGAPDLLVRSDILRRLFPGDLAEDQATLEAPDLPLGPRHYRIVEIKFITLDLLKDGHAGSKHLKYMVQAWLYNEALGRMQGLTPPAAFLLGRRWEASRDRGVSALDRLARVDREREVRGLGAGVRGEALRASDWVRRVRAHGSGWRVLPSPSVDELWPNIRRTDDQPWHHAKLEIAQQLDDLSLLPRVTPEKRTSAMAMGLARWTDPKCSAALLGITGVKNPALVDAVIRANHSNEDGPCVFPERVTVNEALWRTVVIPEFYVDFETVSDLQDDFSKFPELGGQPLIFMIGCGHFTGQPADPNWNFRVFTVRSLSMAEERRIIEEWLAYVRHICEKADMALDQTRLFHWSPAETSNLTVAYNSARVRHGQPPWPSLPWCDLLNDVVREQPVTVRGAFGFGLKAIAKAMHQHGLIRTHWGDGPADGMGAMVGAWWCHDEATRAGVSMPELDLMRDIQSYNEVDCRVMAEALAYLRAHR